jgi:hypothetical protein
MKQHNGESADCDAPSGNDDQYVDLTSDNYYIEINPDFDNSDVKITLEDEDCSVSPDLDSRLLNVHSFMDSDIPSENTECQHEVCLHDLR